MTTNNEPKTVRVGEISDTWLVSHLDDNDQPVPLNDDYTCKMAVFSMSGAEILSREIDEIQDNSFVVFLTAVETMELDPGHQYRLAVQIINESLTPKPIRKSVTRCILAEAGFFE